MFRCARKNNARVARPEYGSKSNSQFSAITTHSINSRPCPLRVIWFANPDIREVVFEIEDSGKPVRVTLDTDRVWWALIDNSGKDTGPQKRVRFTPETRHSARRLK